MKNILLFILFFTSTFTIAQTEADYANPFIYDNAVYKKNIKTVQLNRIGYEFSYPIIRLNSDDKMLLQFDDLDVTIREYAYTIIHCNANWESTNISPSDYIDGYQSQLITEYKYSFNTYTQYLHYKLEFPSEMLKPTKSGNYILKIFLEGDEENVILSRRFMVIDEKISIGATAKPATDVAFRKFKQEIDFNINLGNYNVANPYEDLEVIILQNFRFDNACKKLKPQFINNNLLTYNYEEENTFWAGNEYRYFDIRNLKYTTHEVANISFDNNKNYNIWLTPDEKRSYKKYFDNPDLNGAFSIRVEGSNQPELDAEYVNVHFTLNNPYPEANGDFYVFGELTDWQCKDAFKLNFDAQQKAYTLKTTLKQGYYNYDYAFKANLSNAADEMLVEGSHSETENDYIILVYHTTIGKFHQQLIGFSRINSVKK